MIKSVRKTVLLCCEGKADQSFVAYLRSTYASGRPESAHVTPKQAGGKGGNNVISTLVGELRCSQPDRAVALLDGDEPPSAAKRREANSKGIEFIVLKPCLEGLLLKILGQPVPSSSHLCKDKLKKIDRRQPTDMDFYVRHFPKDVLDKARPAVCELDALLRLFDT